jgi:hypothetical protein
MKQNNDEPNKEKYFDNKHSFNINAHDKNIAKKNLME